MQALCNTLFTTIFYIKNKQTVDTQVVNTVREKILANQ